MQLDKWSLKTSLLSHPYIELRVIDLKERRPRIKRLFSVIWNLADDDDDDDDDDEDDDDDGDDDDEDEDDDGDDGDDGNDDNEEDFKLGGRKKLSGEQSQVASFQADQRLQGTKIMKAKAHVDAENVENELDELMVGGVAQRQRSRFSTNNPGFDFLILK